MSLFQKLSFFKTNGKSSNKNQKTPAPHFRTCRIEQLEDRRVLSADPVVAGITYLEGDSGSDLEPDHFEITFQGGSDTTSMTSFVINGDQDNSGTRTVGDMIFHANSSIAGAGDAFDFTFNTANSIGINADDILSYNVSKDGLRLEVFVKNFEAGDKLAFDIDVDEIENRRPDLIASGIEFETTQFNATFDDAHYDFITRNVSGPGGISTGLFWDEYDAWFQTATGITGTALDLPADDATGHADRTDGAWLAYDLEEKPVSISGRVYHDQDTDCQQDSNEDGIEGVSLTLEKLNASTHQYESVAATKTNEFGDYSFGIDLNLKPGTYRVIQTQPADYISVGAMAGTVDGTNVGSTISDSSGQPNVLSDIIIPMGGQKAINYNFCEVKPVSLSGHVYHDRNDNGIMESGEEGIANVEIQVRRTGGVLGTNDPFAAQNLITLITDSNGHYSITGLPPGTYELLEVNQYTGVTNPLANYIDGKDQVGNVDGFIRGVGGNDKFSLIALTAGENSMRNDFGELKPVSLKGFVSEADPNGNCTKPGDTNYKGIAGVTIQILNSDGRLVTQTVTNTDGLFVVKRLAPGNYTIVEVQPDNYLDGSEHVGMVGTTSVGELDGNDRIANISLTSGQNGEMYGFCEHLPAKIAGTVFHDRNNNGIQDSGEEGIAGVTLELLNANGDPILFTGPSGNQIALTLETDQDGNYCFEDLYAGTYSIREVQPVDYNDGIDSIGTLGGTLSNDLVREIVVQSGQTGMNYNFGELKPISIKGYVSQADENGNCTMPGDSAYQGVEGVTIQLLDSRGVLISSTQTLADGTFKFTDLLPGEYTIREIQPTNLLDGNEMIGSVLGSTVGQFSGNDSISKIILQSGDQAVKYGFCEHLPAELGGTVYHDRNDNGVQDRGEEGIAGVTIRLLNADGSPVTTTVGSTTTVLTAVTDLDGNYSFANLKAGEYRVQEIQPGSFNDGKDTVGSNGGQVSNDLFTKVIIREGDSAVNYDFGELLLGSIAGYVHVDSDGNCIPDSPSDTPISGVTMELLDPNGSVLQRTTTNADGFYKFTGLLPGTYSVRQIQPDNFFSTGEMVGHLSGHTDVKSGTVSPNMISNISLRSNFNMIQYNFCESVAASIAGRVFQDGAAFESDNGLAPSNYRELRDGRYTTDDTNIGGTKMLLYWYIDPVAEEIAPRPVTLSEVMRDHYSHITGGPDAAVYVYTDANGQYRFDGLVAGSYIVLQEQPENYIDSNDTPGTTTGTSFNNVDVAAAAPAAVLSTFSQSQVMDAVVNIQVTSGGVSLANNFSEIRVQTTPDNPDLPNVPLHPPTIPTPAPPSVPGTGFPGLYGHQSINSTTYVGSGFGGVMGEATTDYSWHLSVINGGSPRDGVEGKGGPWHEVGYLSEMDWSRYPMDQGDWTFTTVDEQGNYSINDRTSNFGTEGGRPIAGDFNGDGFDEIGIFKDGFWFMDANGNGIWDSKDLMARLGNGDDQAVVGDWDGDGKDDIGIYGPAWSGDEEAILNEPGLPDRDNFQYTRPKNIPPQTAEATQGSRILKDGITGRNRADVIDHVFGYGKQDDVAIVGDFNGDGIHTIGLFKAGKWTIDTNGDGKLNSADGKFQFGQAGDYPVVGDFDGDGVDEVAIFRNGKWYIDSNGDRELDATDRVFEMNGLGIPLAADFDGDGKDEPILYRVESDPYRKAN